MKTIENKLYQHIDAITGGILKFISSPDGYLKLRSSGYMDLSIERLGANEMSFTHYYKQSGDLVSDPDIQVEIDFEKHSAKAITYQDAYCFQTVYLSEDRINQKLQKDLNSFLYDWLKRLKEQGFYK